MCIVFMYVNNNPESGDYQLILASNRDEFYTRPSKPAARWLSHPHCISGLDLEADKAGGTWLGVSERGKVGLLLNVATPDGPDKTKLGRGSLVSDFLTSGQSPGEYVTSIVQERHRYNAFNLVLMQHRKKQWEMLHVGSNEVEPSSVLEPGVHGWANCGVSTPWIKLQRGKARFSEIVNQNHSTSTRDALVEKLLQLLNDRSPNLPDPELSAVHSSKGPEVTSRLSALNVHLSSAKYGTRTNTLVLIDREGRSEYIERTMREPINPDRPEWQIQDLPFTLVSHRST